MDKEKVGGDGKNKEKNIEKIIMKGQEPKIVRKKPLVTEINSIDDLLGAIETHEGYMLGITMVNQGQLRHYLLTNNFPLLDLLKSWKKVKGLAIEQLERDPDATDY